MTERPTVLVDMDGVLAGFHERVITTIQEEHPHIDTRRNYGKFYVADDFPEILEQARAVSDRPNFFSSLGVIKGAVEGWRSLVEAGFHPQICSAPLLSHPNSVAEKLLWLEQHFVPEFGGHIIDEAFIKRDKTTCDGLALIDDKPKITGSQVPSWKHIMFTQSYNASVMSEYRINGWQDTRLIPILKNLAKVATN